MSGDKVHVPECGAEEVEGQTVTETSNSSEKILVSNVDADALGSGEHLALDAEALQQAATYYSPDEEKQDRILVANPGSNADDHSGFTPEGSPPPIYMPRVREQRSEAQVSFVNAVFEQTDGDSVFDDLSLSDLRDPEDCCDPCMACCGCIALRRFNKGGSKLHVTAVYSQTVHVLTSNLLNFHVFVILYVNR